MGDLRQAESSWVIPKDAKLGSYQIRLSGGGAVKTNAGMQTGEIRVEEFRIPVMKATIQPPAVTLVTPSQVSFDLSVRYLAGGGAAHQAVKLRSWLEEKTVTFIDDFEGFIFANSAVKEGVVRRSGDQEYEGGEFYSDSGENLRGADGAVADTARIHVVDLKLDKSGTARAAITKLPAITKPMEMLAELESNDPSGQVQTASSRVALWLPTAPSGSSPTPGRCRESVSCSMSRWSTWPANLRPACRLEWSCSNVKLTPIANGWLAGSMPTNKWKKSKNPVKFAAARAMGEAWSFAKPSRR
jgi:alpha-2-macroglobulin